MLNQIFRKLRGAPFQLFSFGSLLGLGFFSYRVRELLTCWFLLSLFLAALAMLFLGAVLAGYAAKYIGDWVQAALSGTPLLAILPVELHAKALSAPVEFVLPPYEGRPSSSDCREGPGEHAGRPDTDRAT